MLDKSRLTDVERDLVDGLDGLLEDLKGDVAITEKYTCRRVVLDLQPEAYTPEQVKSTRQILGVSQALFAAFLGTSPKTVAAWERGAKPPKDIACRFMDEIRRDPDYWKKRLRESIRTKAT